MLLSLRGALCILYNTQLLQQEARIIASSLQHLSSSVSTRAAQGCASSQIAGIGVCQVCNGKRAFSAWTAHYKQPKSRAALAAAEAAAAEAAEADAVKAAALVCTTSPLRPLELVDPADISQQKQLTIDGKPLTGDPCTIKYTAPVYIPEPLRAGIPRVLYTDPWTPVEDLQLKKQHAKAVFEFLDASERPLTAAEVFEGMNRGEGPSSPMFGSMSYVKDLLENMRRNRMVMGQKNPDHPALSHGHPDHPRLYAVHLYQKAQKGCPKQNALVAAAIRERKLKTAFSRMRHGKPPHRINRRRAYMSAFQYEMALDTFRQAQAL